MVQLKKILSSLIGVNFRNALSAIIKQNKNDRLLIKKLSSQNFLFKKYKADITELAVIDNTYFYACPKYSFGENNSNKLNLYGKFNNYVLSLKNVTIIGDSNFLLFKRKSLIYFSETFYNDNTQINDDALVAQFCRVCLLRVNNENKDIEKGLYFIGYNSHNYYHLLYEIVARYEYITNLKLDVSIPILLDAACKDVVQYQELHRYFNKDNRRIIYIDKHTRYNVRSLIYITTPNFIPTGFKHFQNIKADNVLFSSSSISFLNLSLSPVLKTDKYPSKIYLSRKIASSRRGFNEEQIENFLNSKGYFSFNALDYSISEQLSHFYNADVIIGGSGAAFSNIFICKEHCKIILFSNYKFDLSTFSTIAALKNLNFIHIYDKSLILDNRSGLHDDYKIDIHELNQYL